MKYKKEHPNHKEYRLDHPYCELCGYNGFNKSIHHHIKQKVQLIEHASNYTMLCNNYNAGANNCHGIYHSPNLSQFIREIKIPRGSTFYGWPLDVVYEYLGKLKI